MKKLTTFLSLLSLFVVTSVQAEDVILKDNTPILGNWNLYAEAPALNKEKKEVNISWDFKKDGFIHTKASDVRATGSMLIKVKYSIEDGKIKKQVAPGREKYESCRVVSLEDKKMILKCRYLFFFLEKK